MENGLKIINRFLFLFFFSGICFADNTIEHDFNYLNQLRLSTQLIPLTWNSALANAAQNHAKYLSVNNRQGHYEQQGLKDFSGEWASERAIFSHYPNRLVGENITSKIGEKLYFNSIDNLMSAIYHRLGFLDLNIDEIGIGQQFGKTDSYVYVMGNSALSIVCQQASFKKAGTYHFNVCNDSTKRIEASLFDKAKQSHQINNPKIVLWPANQATNVAPAFFQESPDPLPHHEVSGYPISIQFNPAFFKTAPKLISFNVYLEPDKIALKPIVVMNKENDPHHKFTAYQHAFFPEQRLKWGATYSATIEYINQESHKNQHITWSFQTQRFKEPLLNITQETQKIKVKVGQTLVLYFPPQNAHDIQTAVSTKDYNMQLKLLYVDKNTLKVFITQQGKAEIRFHNKLVELFSP